MAVAHPGFHVRSQANPKLILIAALFFSLAGNIPLLGGFSLASDGSSALVRGAGLGAAILLVSIALHQQGTDGLRRILFFLTPFFAFLLFCMISAAWSLEPGATLVRSAESLVTIAFFAFWTHAVVRACDSEKEVCAWIVLGVLAFVIYGIAVNTLLFGDPIRMVMSNEESGRLRLVFGGLHPLAVGDIVAAGAIATVLSDFSALRKFVALLIFIPLLILTDATGARILVALIFGICGFAWVVRGIGWPRVVVLLIPFGIAAGFAVAILYSVESPLAQGVSGDDRIWSLTGRTELWGVIWDSGLANTWFGTGFDAARGAISDVFGVAYQAHNQYLSILVELGYAGAILFVPVFLLWLLPVMRSRSLAAWCFALYVIGINMNNASMLTKTWLIFPTVFCYILPLEERMKKRADSRGTVPVRRRASSGAGILAQR